MESLSRGKLKQTVLKGERPESITVQVLNIKVIKNSDDKKFRVALWDGVDEYVFGVYMKHQPNDAAPSPYSIIRVADDEKPHGLDIPLPFIRPIPNKAEPTYAFGFSHYTLVKDGSQVGKKIPSDIRTFFNSQQNKPASPSENTPPQQVTPSRASSTSSPAALKPKAATNGSGSSHTPTSKPAPVSTNARSAVKRNLEESYNNGASAAKQARPELGLGGATHQIAALNPYQNKYKIKAKVTQLKDIRQIQTSRFQGQDNYGDTPVMEAAQLHKEETFKLLSDIKDEGSSLEKMAGDCGRSKEERMKRETVCQKKAEERKGVFIDKIENINKKIKDSEQRWTKVVEKQELESQKLARKHQKEKNQQELERQKLVKKHQKEITKQELERKKLAKKHQEEKTQQEKTFKREADTNNLHMTNLTEVINELAQDLTKINFDKGKNDAANNNDDHGKLEAARRSLECPICLESMKSPKRIWMCLRTHAMCGDCKILLNGKPCPTCGSGSVNLRAYIVEKMAEIVFNKSEV